MRPFISADLTGIHDRPTKWAIANMNEAIRDISLALTAVLGNSSGADTSSLLTGPTTTTEAATVQGFSLLAQSYVVANDDPALINNRILAVDETQLSLTDGGPKGNITLGIADPVTMITVIANSVNTNRLTVNIESDLHGITNIGYLGVGTLTFGTSLLFDAAGTYTVGSALNPAFIVYANGLEGACRLTPALTFGTTNVKGANQGFIPADSTLAIFDSTVPADIAATATTGSAAFAARRDHVHRFPTSLMEYTNSKKLVLTSTSTVMTLTPDVATLILASATTTFRPSSTNTQTWGATGQRIKQLFLGSSGLDITGPITGDLTPTSDITNSLGSGAKRWLNVYCTVFVLGDQFGTAFNNFFVVGKAAGSGMTADRSLNIFHGDADRTINLGGNVTFPSGSAYTPSNVTTDRSYDANATTLDEIADVLGTLIADLQTAGVIT